ncbi:MAG: hypothetical protein AAFV98_05740 [Chloroflexota bacterium]
MKNKTLVWFVFTVMLSSFFIVPVIAQDDEDTAETDDNIVVNEPLVYVCTDDGVHRNLIEYNITEPIGLIFDRTLRVTIFSPTTTNFTVDMIEIEPDTDSGTYRWVETIVGQANFISNALGQNICQHQHREFVGELLQTIPLPITPRQALIIRQDEVNINYAEETAAGTLIIGAVGLLFETETASQLPNFQLLKIVGGEDDIVSLRFPLIEEELDLFVVSRQRLSYYNIDALGFESTPTFLDTRDRFLSRLTASGGDFMDTIMSVGEFRMRVNYGKEIFYEPGGSLELSRISSFVPRSFTEGAIIFPITCMVDENAEVSYYRSEAYAPENYFLDAGLGSVGRTNCTNQIEILEVLENGILRVNTAGTSGDSDFYIAAWLVDERAVVEDE